MAAGTIRTHSLMRSSSLSGIISSSGGHFFFCEGAARGLVAGMERKDDVCL